MWRLLARDISRLQWSSGSSLAVVEKGCIYYTWWNNHHFQVSHITSISCQSILFLYQTSETRSNGKSLWYSICSRSYHQNWQANRNYKLIISQLNELFFSHTISVNMIFENQKAVRYCITPDFHSHHIWSFLTHKK
jgi:hypothetical protein